MTPKQFEAIVSYAAINGRLWKSNLRRDWERSYYPYFDQELVPYLQQLRNQRGPSWLAKFRLDCDAVKAYQSISRHAAA